MKKIYALAAVALMAMSANAQDGAPLYITGGSIDTNNSGFVNGDWNPTTPDEFTYADGVYSIHIDNLVQFKISSACGDWDLFNAEAIGVPEYTKDMLGTPVALEPWGENVMCPWAGDYDIVVAGDLSTITLTTTTEDPGDEIAIYLRGDMNGWGSPEEWLFTSLDGNVFKLTCSDDMAVLAGETFKVADALWAKYNFGAAEGFASYMLDAPLPVQDGSNDNMVLEEDWNGVCYFCLDESLVFFSNDKDADCPFEIKENAVSNISVESSEAPVYFNLQGVRVANPENGLFIVVKDGKAVKVVK